MSISYHKIYQSILVLFIVMISSLMIGAVFYFQDIREKNDAGILSFVENYCHMKISKNFQGYNRIVYSAKIGQENTQNKEQINGGNGIPKARFIKVNNNYWIYHFTGHVSINTTNLLIERDFTCVVKYNHSIKEIDNVEFLLYDDKQNTPLF